MGSEITLAVGNFEVDWGKNSVFLNHSPLFQPNDIRQVEYRYVGSDVATIIESKPGLAKPLREVLPRLELLGHTLDTARKQYQELLKLNNYRVEVDFDQLAAVLSMLDVKSVSPHYETGCDFGEFFSREIYERLRLGEVVGGCRPGRDDLGEVMENFHPWSVLRLLAENPENLDLPVTWHTADVIEGGWVDDSDIAPELSTAQRFLVVTEGSSDAKIIQKAMQLLRPEVGDFFYFVDMEEGYPFTGTGNLHKFCHGLASIRILNRTIVVYDNDAEGTAKWQEARLLTLPPNMRIVKLPDVPDFEHFRTVGPNGITEENINGRAASIECYLDMSWRVQEPPLIRWTSYNARLDLYQGELGNKERYKREFLDLRRPEPSYDFSRLTVVLRVLIDECTRIAALGL